MSYIDADRLFTSKSEDTLGIKHINRIVDNLNDLSDPKVAISYDPTYDMIIIERRGPNKPSLFVWIKVRPMNGVTIIIRYDSPGLNDNFLHIETAMYANYTTQIAKKIVRMIRAFDQAIIDPERT